jgi:hypothetical protein
MVWEGTRGQIGVAVEVYCTVILQLQIKRHDGAIIFRARSWERGTTGEQALDMDEVTVAPASLGGEREWEQ